MKPKPWSFSALDTFKTCPRQYEAKYVSKSVQEEKSEQMIWGEIVHKHFEDRQAVGTPLPPELEMHEPYMQRLQDKPGEAFTELKIGFNKRAQPCEFFDDNVWWRGVIDYLKVDRETGRAFIVDYKTGKPHQKFDQLQLFALHTIASYPEVTILHLQFYWTKTLDVSRVAYTREEVEKLWKKFLPDLKQYAEAFKTDTWQPRQSGLCHGWCPVTDCEFWKPKRRN